MRPLAPILFAALISAAPGPTQPAASLAGTWDLVWQTRHGPSRSGFLVIEQQGNRIIAEIHGQGQVKAKGELSGNSFALHGSRMLVPYTLSGRVEGEKIEGSLQVLSVTRQFTGTRRRIN